MGPKSRRKRAHSKTKTPGPLSDDARFTKTLKVTGKDGDLGLIGEYHMKDDLFEGFPRYEKIGVDPRRRGQRRFLTHFNVNMGHWVFSDWEEVLLLGPLADKLATPKSPDKYEGKYEVFKEARRRCLCVANIRVTPLKTPSNAATSSSVAEQQQPVKTPHHGANEDDTDSSDNEVVETDGIMTCKKHRLEVCEKCGINNVQTNEEVKKILEQIRYTDENGFWYCVAHRKEICGICFESYRPHNELLRARKLGEEVDEDTRAVRERLLQQMLETILIGTDMESNDDDDDHSCCDLSAADRKKKCEHCGKKGNFKCKRCNFIYYCSEAHQAAHQAKHQILCDQLEGVKLTHQQDSKQSDTSNSKTTTSASVSVCQKEELPMISTLANSDPSASCLKINSAATSVDAGGPSAPVSKLCAYCGEGGKLSVCSRCKVAFYCSKEHQRADYPTHKRGCRQLGDAQKTAAPPAKKPDVKVATWEQLEQEEPYPLYGRTLKVRIISQPFIRGACDGRDSQGQVRRLAFYCNPLPKGLEMGCVLRWSNPVFHYFLDGSCGARINDEDLPFVTCSDN